MRLKTPKSLLLFSLAVLFLALVLIGAGIWEKVQLKRNTETASGNSASENYYDTRAVYFDGEPYYRRNNIDTFLLIGLDRNGEMKDSGSYNNNDRADVLVLLVIDHTKGKYTLIPVNRDTMTYYDKIGLNDEVIGREYGQIALSHTYGNGLQRSCENTRGAVDYLLYEVGIDHYLSMTMDVIGMMSDAVGGVTVEFDRDYTDIRPEYTVGTRHTFTGIDTEEFIRARSGLEDPTNTARMKRQKLYLETLLKTIQAKKMSSSDMKRLYDDMKDYLVTDCDRAALSETFDFIAKYDYAGVAEIAGEAVAGEEFMEFHADNDSIKQIVLEHFYQKIYLNGDTGND